MMGEMRSIQVNGVILHYEVVGKGKPVVLVHGNGGSHNDFHVEIRQLAEAGYQVYGLDSRGQGANAPLNEYHYDDMAEDVYQFIMQLGLKRPAFYGWSDGGVIGLLLELAHPGTVSLMVISGTNLTANGMRPDVIAYYRKIYEEAPTPLYKMMLTEPNIDAERLRNIRVPVLVTAGSEDGILESDTRTIADRLPNSRLMILEGEDHCSYIVDSKIMGSILLAFLKEHGY